MKLLKQIPDLATLVLLLFIAYSCETDECYNTAESSNGDSFNLIQSIGESDEFIDYVMSLQRITKKVDAYYSALSESEKLKFEIDLNNDDYAERLIAEMDIEKELEDFVMANKKLIDNTSFGKLKDAEQTELFNSYSYILEFGLVKTRAEGPNEDNPCESARKNAVDQAGKALLERQKSCGYLYPSGTEGHALCLLSAAITHKKAVDKANKDYEECMKK